VTAAPDSNAPLRRALSALERSRIRLEAAERERSEPIAIVGAGCRLPGGVGDLDSYWALLERGGDAVTTMPQARWNTTGRHDPDRTMPGKVYSDAMAVIDAADRFDAAFFGISAREAERMDPQQRVLLEVAAEAIEHAGLSTDALRGSASGVFVGICANDFSNRYPIEALDTYSATGRALATASGRLSYTFGFHGPSLSLDTACSSSLVAVHLACQSLRKGETTLAIAAGVHVTAGAETSVGMAKLNALSLSGRCRAFSDDADGYVRGEGCVALVLKRLGDALRDGDRILATVRGSAVNQDGRSNGLTAPNGQAQAALLGACLAQARVNPADVGYLEAHGTGTELGDPIELNAAASVYGAGRAPAEPLWVGSGKTNLGHLEAAAGLTGLLRAMLAIRHATIPPNLHFRAPNPHVDWAALPLRVPTALTSFPVNGAGSRIAGVSSFGFSGTNAHVLVEQAPMRAAAADERDGRDDWLVLSAACDAALRTQALRFADRLRRPDTPLGEICRTTRQRRGRHAARLAVIGSSAVAMAAALEDWAAGRASPGVLAGQPADRDAGVVAVFPGHGAQWAGMGQELHAAGGTFRRVFDDCDAAIQAHSGRSASAALFASADDLAQFDASIVQPLLFALAVALAAHVRAQGIEFRAVVGQSLGEVAAAVVAGALSIDDGARIITARSRLAATARGGAMAAIDLGLAELEAAIAAAHSSVTLAASNGPASTLVSGEERAVDEFIAGLQARQIHARRLRVDYASHSAFMDPLLEPLRQALQGIAPRPGRIPIYSTVTGAVVSGPSLTPDHWVANLRRPVLFQTAVDRLVEDGFRLFAEISPRPGLVSDIEDALAQAGVAGRAVATMRADEPQWRSALAACAALHVAGAASGVPGQPAGTAELPSYPWATTTFALPPAAPTTAMASAEGGWVGAARSIAGQPGTWVCEGRLDPGHALVAQHRVNSSAILPGAGFLTMVLDGAAQAWPGREWWVVDTCFDHVLAVGEDQATARVVQLVLCEEAPGWVAWTVSSREAGGAQDWTAHARGKLRAAGSPAEEPAAPAHAPDAPWAVVARMRTSVDGATLYGALQGMGLDYGARFRAIESLWCTDGEFIARFAPHATRNGSPSPDAFLLDACLHGLAWLGLQGGGALQVPVSVASVQVAPPAAPALWVHGTRRSEASGLTDDSIADLVLRDAQGLEVGRITGVRARSPDGGGTTLPGQGRWLHRQEWVARAAVPDSGAGSAAAWMLIGAGGAMPEPELAKLRARLHGAELVRWDRADGAQFLRVRLAQWRAAIGQRDACIAYLGDSVGTAGLNARQQLIDTEAAIGALHVVQAVLQAFEGARAPGVSFITEGTQVAAGGDTVALGSLGDSALWGFARALCAEHPELRTRCIDLPRASSARDVAALADELLGGSAQTEVALRGERWVGRLARTGMPAESAPMARGAQAACRLEIDRPGVLGSLTLRAIARSLPAADEVEIEVDAAALNFADLMRAMGFFLAEGEERVTLGSECAGTISRMGEGVTGLHVGQRVVGLGAHCFASHVNVKACFVAAQPARLSAAAAAALPIASMTAWYALRQVASLQAGQRILIHSATGGTGLAAVQLAQAIGAEVLATAGSEAKRQRLHDLGVNHVFDSRTSDFERQALEATGGEGVDVVLNSLSGNAIEQSLRTLAPDGWFLELGKRDIHAGGRLPLHHFKKRLRYVAIDLAGMQRERPGRFAELFRLVMAATYDRQLQPLPTEVFPVSRAREAFQRMAAAQHVGKLVLELRDPEAAVSAGGGPAPLLRETQLITGGLGGLGLDLAAWLVAQGVRSLVLMGRSAPGVQALARLDELRRLGTEIRVMQVDVGSRTELAAALQAIAAGMPPLRGVFHLAGVLEDGLLAGQDAAAFRRVLRSKADAACHLHALTRDLDSFILYSSAAVLLPSPAQASYAAANAFLDALATHRHGQGLPALSLQWGPFSGVGLAAARAGRGDRLAERGTPSMTTAQSHAYLGQLMKRSAATLGVFPLQGARWLAASPTFSSLPRFDPIRDGIGGRVVPEPSSVLADGETAAGRFERIQALLRRHAAAVLRLPESEIAANMPFQQLGLDSLTSLELRNRIEGDLGRRLSSAMLWRHPCVRALAEFLSDMPSGAPGDPAVPVAALPTLRVVPDDWFLIPRRSPKPRLRVFCIPFLGGMASVFSPWARRLPPDVELQALQLPGRPPRHKEKPHAEFQALVDALLQALSTRIDVPYVIYGHSLGALVGFGLAHALRAAGAPMPRHLFLAAYPAPHLHNPLADIGGLPDADFIQALERLRGIPEQVSSDPELLAVFLPSLRAELALLNSYVHVARVPLDVPTTLLGGASDHLVSRGEIEGWRQHLAGAVASREIDGGHFFLRESEQEVMDTLLATLADMPSASGQARCR
jgi:acyl transferase domain-containing protein/surfactin synthase thioesterase subunit/NADPH:quinone reductase-like Zn-dependent oxidoreductase